MRILLSLVLVTSVTTVVNAQQLRIGVYGSPPSCEFTPVQPVGQAHVIVQASVPFQTVRFRAPVPACNGLAYIGEASPFPIVSGDSQTGIEINVGPCTNAPVEVLTITYLSTGTTDVCQWEVEPAAGDATIEVVDCDGFLAKGASTYSGWMGTFCFIGEDWTITGYRPVPSDGAGAVPVNQTLAWVGPVNTIWLADHSFDDVIPGHDHIADDVIAEDFPLGSIPPPFDPGSLAPETTYHWYVGNICYGCVHGPGAISDTWSFTTEGTVATNESSWGRIKALYR